MKWIPALILSLAMLGAAQAAGPDDQYLEIYSLIQQADVLKQASDARSAAAKYTQAQSGLKKLQEVYPNWNPDVVKFRLEYVSGKLADVTKDMPKEAAPAKAAKATPRVATLPELQQQIADLAEQVRSLAAEKTDLERKLREALSVKPAAVDPELVKAQEEVLTLKKERDLLNASLEMEKTAARSANKAKPANEAAEAKAAKDREELQVKLDLTVQTAERLKTQLAAANSEISSLRAAGEQLKEAQSAKANLEKECADLKKKLADAEAKVSKRATTPDLSAELSAAKLEVARLKASDDQLKDAQKLRAKLEKETEDLKKKLAAKEAKKSSKANDSEIEVLRARLAVLEALPIPYTPEEQALIKTVAQPKAATVQVEIAQATNAAAAPVKKAIRSAKDLPPGAGALMADAQRSFVTGDYVTAEKKYKTVLDQDENNVYVLSHLANAQMAQNHFEDAEATIQKGLKSDPDDAATLFLLGNLRLRQEKIDEALSALSRSATINPTNAVTQNSLGSALSRKGQTKAAETALRKALQLDPKFPEAHHNLAIIYSTQKPPSLELARWHYKKALDLGQPKNPDLEKILNAPAAPSDNAQK